MVRTLVVAGFLLWSFPAFSQGNFDGLDLSDDKKSKSGDTTADQSGKEMAPVREVDVPERVIPESRAALAELDIIREDRVKSVQRKLYLKRNRFELAPYVAFAVNDPYYNKFGLAARGAFYLSDSVALSTRFTWMQIARTDDVRLAKREFQSDIYFSVPIWSLMGNVEWSPVYGKASFQNSIIHFDGYVLGGAGAVITASSSLPNRGPNPAADVGVGVRFVVKDFFAVNTMLTNTTYVEQPGTTTKASMQNLMMLNAGVSLFFPFKSTYREAE